MIKKVGKRRLIGDFSANLIQTLATQFFGLVIFYFMSKYLPKNDYGEFNWSMALGSTIIAIASFGLDLLFVKRVATEENTGLISGLHLFHALTAGIILCGGVFVIHLFFPSFSHLHPLFLFIFISLTIANIANSLKLYLNGLESYKQLAVISLFANALKLLFIVILFLTSHFNMRSLIGSFIVTSLCEFLLAYYFIKKITTVYVKPVFKKTEYKKFILQSLPQLGVVIFDSALARVDWIILGILTTAVATAEYSFAYKIFELSRLPLLVIAPVLLTRFSKWFSGKELLSEKLVTEINLFLQLELFVLMFIPIVLVCVWSPVIDYFTDNKYGAVNEKNYWLLSLCVPLHGIINFLWTMGFVQGRLNVILYVTISVSVLNILSNLIVIPIYGTFGASISFLLSTLVQLVLYLRFIKHEQVKLNIKNILIVFMNASLAVVVSKLFITNVVLTTFAALAIYLGLNVLLKQVGLKQIKQILQP